MSFENSFTIESQRTYFLHYFHFTFHSRRCLPFGDQMKMSPCEKFSRHALRVVSNTACKQPERIRIPKFSGDKMKYSTWWAVFSSCVDETSLSPQFKMLQLESCLEGKAAKTVRGLGYSSEAYEAVKARLNRNYGPRKLATGSSAY